MVYATCSIFKEENDKIIDQFLQNHTDFMYAKIEQSNIEKDTKDLHKIQLYQNAETDGFFICKLQRK